MLQQLTALLTHTILKGLRQPFTAQARQNLITNSVLAPQHGQWEEFKEPRFQKDIKISVNYNPEEQPMKATPVSSPAGSLPLHRSHCPWLPVNESLNLFEFRNPRDALLNVFKTSLPAFICFFIFIALFNLYTPLVLSVKRGQKQSWLEYRFSLAQWPGRLTMDPFQCELATEKQQ